MTKGDPAIRDALEETIVHLYGKTIFEAVRPHVAIRDADDKPVVQVSLTEEERDCFGILLEGLTFQHEDNGVLQTVQIQLTSV